MIFLTDLLKNFNIWHQNQFLVFCAIFFFVFDPLTEKYFIRLHEAFAMNSLVLCLYSCKKKIKLNIKKTLNDNILSDFLFEIFNRIFCFPRSGNKFERNNDI